MKCSKCGHEQADGKFCASCGGELVAKAEASETPTQSQVNASNEEIAEQQASATSEDTNASSQQEQKQSNESLDKVIETSKQFGSFFQQFLKSPSHVLSSGANQFINAIIILVALVLLFSIAAGRIVSSLLNFGGLFGSLVSGPSFFEVFGSAFLVIILLLAITIGAIFLINKFFGNEELSFTDIVSIYGVYMIPTSIIAVLALFFALIKSGFTVTLLFLTVSFSIFIIPLYIIGYLVSNFRKNLDPFYAYLIYVAVSGIAFWIVFKIFSDSVMSSLIGGFNPFGGF